MLLDYLHSKRIIKAQKNYYFYTNREFCCRKVIKFNFPDYYK